MAEVKQETTAPAAPEPPTTAALVGAFVAEKSQATLAAVVLAVVGKEAAPEFVRGLLPLVGAPAAREEDGWIVTGGVKRKAQFDLGKVDDDHVNDDESAGVTLDYFKNDEIDVEERTLMLMVPDAAVATVIGTAGVTVKQIQTSTTTKIDIQASKDMVPGQHERKVSITGTIKNANIAQYLINMKVAEKMAADAAARWEKHVVWAVQVACASTSRGGAPLYIGLCRWPVDLKGWPFAAARPPEFACWSPRPRSAS